MSTDAPVIVETEAGVRTLTMNRPEARNAFNRSLWQGLTDAFEAAKNDNEVRVVILTGAAGAFTAGQDLGEMSSTMAADGEGGGAHPFGACMDQLIGFDKVLIAAVNGVGVGFGLTALLHCDIVTMAEGARVKVPFVNLGVVPEAASSYLLPLRVGHQAAAEILYTAEWVSAEKALAVGLASHVFAPDRLMAETKALAARIAVHPLGSLRHTKQLVREPLLQGIREARAREDAAFTVRVGSAENVEAIKAFFEKRAPDFSGIDPS